MKKLKVIESRFGVLRNILGWGIMKRIKIILKGVTYEVAGK